MRLAVIGGGIGGLTSARALVAAGHDTHVFEAAARAGGVIESSRVDGFLREHAASSFLGGPADGAYALCEELGVPVVKAAPAARRRWIYIDGKLRALPGNPIEFARSDLLTWRGKLELLREPLRAARTPGEDESMYAFASRRLGPQAARAIVAPFVTGVFAADAHEVSLEAGFPRLAALDAAGGVVRGMVKTLLSAKRTKRTPRGMYAPIGGVGALADALAAKLGSRLRVRAPVRAVEPGGHAVLVDGERFDGAILAVPAPQAASIARVPELVPRLASFRRSPIALVFLGYEAAHAPAAADGFGFLVAHGEALRVLGCVFESTVWPDRAPAGRVLLRCVYGGGRDPDAAALSDAELVATARRDLATALGIDVEPVHASIVRWTAALAQYAVGHKDKVAAASVAARSKRIALAGADYRGAGVNDLCADAAAVVGEVDAWG